MSQELLPGCKSAFNVMPCRLASVEEPNGIFIPVPTLKLLFFPRKRIFLKLYLANNTASPIPEV